MELNNLPYKKSVILEFVPAVRFDEQDDVRVVTIRNLTTEIKDIIKNGPLYGFKVNVVAISRDYNRIIVSTYVDVTPTAEGEVSNEIDLLQEASYGDVAIDINGGIINPITILDKYGDDVGNRSTWAEGDLTLYAPESYRALGLSEGREVSFYPILVNYVG